jgi:hypothetical protein
LTEDASNYINIDGKLVNEIIGDYERCLSKKDSMDFLIFD